VDAARGRAIADRQDANQHDTINTGTLS